MRSALYVGEIAHTRRGRPRHRFVYRSVSLLIDLDEIAALASGLRLLSIDGAGLYSFHGRDFGARQMGDLKRWAMDSMRRAGRPAERVELLCFPRMLGYVFNPLAVFFGYDASGGLTAVIHQVSNTFGEKHSYVMAATETAGGVVHQTCDKDFYVSPFLPGHGRYRFRFRRPGDELDFALGFRAGAFALTATHRARREVLSDLMLLKRFVTHPWMTLKVIGGIHWEAFRLWRRGAPVYRHAPAPRHRTTVVDPVSGASVSP